MKTIKSPRGSFVIWMVFGLLLTLLAPSFARAGANETPGQNFRPKTFGAFSPNLWEFGANEIPIFQRIVVGSQHYRQGAIYADKDKDLGSGGGGIWNFFLFCTNRANDVMFVTSHGFNTPSTLVEAYPYTAAGRAVRDSVLTYYAGVFPAGRVVAQNIRNNFYGIAVTQAFYTAYFQTPQAFAWWSTCFSSLLAMTGPAEARAFLGYDNNVGVAKCPCDENYILKRMDGQSGQGNRPLGAAFAGVNGACPPGGANLVLQGKPNTVLSPSVLANAPIGIVCEPTPGFVKFDCTMDMGVNPANVVIARGDGILVNHRWAADDLVTFDVIPIRPCPTILYDVIESQARSKANRSRLDGNTMPPVNALGPNHDDYIWWTWCPCWPWIPCWVPDLTYTVDPTPGQILPLYTGVMNHSPNVLTVSGTLLLNGIETQVQNFTVPPNQMLPVTWSAPIPPSAQPGDILQAQVNFVGNFDPITVHCPIEIRPFLRLEPLGAMEVFPSQTQSFFDVFFVVPHDGPVDASGLRLIDTQGWAQPSSQSLHLETGEGTTLSLPYLVPMGTAPGSTSDFSVQCVINGQTEIFPLGTVGVTVPLNVRRLGDRAMVPGSNDAIIDIELVSLSLQSVQPICVASSSDGWPCSVQCPPIPPQGTVNAQIMMQVPVDPSLVGHQGHVDLTIQDSGGLTMQRTFEYTIGPAIKVTALPQSVYTGSSGPKVFPWNVTVENLSDVPLNGVVQLVPSALQTVMPSFSYNLQPNGQLVRNVALRVNTNLAVGTYPIEVMVQSNPPIGNQQVHVEHQVTQPVLVSLVLRSYSGESGEAVHVRAALTNLRTDHAMSGQFHWTDTRGWLSGPLNGSYVLAPGVTDSMEIICTPGGALSSNDDSTQVTLTADLLWDTGLAATSSGTTMVYMLPTSADVGDEFASATTGLGAAYPNPVRESAQVRFALAKPGRVSLVVHDAQGRRIATLADGLESPGEHLIGWARVTDDGRRAPSGIYFLRLVTDEGVSSKKIVLVE